MRAWMGNTGTSTSQTQAFGSAVVSHYRHFKNHTKGSFNHTNGLTEPSKTRAAVCLTGLLTHGMQGSAAISEASQLERMKTWRSAIEAGGVAVDVFVYTELSEHPPKTIKTEKSSIGRSGDGDREVHSVRPSRLIEVLRVLNPVKILLHDEPPYCVQRPSYCRDTKSWPRWLEQMFKVNRCMRLVHEYERETRRPYDWIIQMRSDYNTDGADHNAKAANVLGVLRTTARDSRVVHMKPFFAPPGYGQADMFWVAPRPAADAMASVVNASSAWLQCITATAPAHVQNERLLVEWALRSGITVVKMPPAANPRLTLGISSPQARSPYAKRCDSA